MLISHGNSLPAAAYTLCRLGRTEEDMAVIYLCGTELSGIIPDRTEAWWMLISQISIIQMQ